MCQDALFVRVKLKYSSIKMGRIVQCGLSMRKIISVPNSLKKLPARSPRGEHHMILQMAAEVTKEAAPKECDRKGVFKN